jgi:hypothetical protein
MIFCKQSFPVCIVFAHIGACSCFCSSRSICKVLASPASRAECGCISCKPATRALQNTHTGSVKHTVNKIALHCTTCQCIKQGMQYTRCQCIKQGMQYTRIRAAVHTHGISAQSLTLKHALIPANGPNLAAGQVRQAVAPADMA